MHTHHHSRTEAGEGEARQHSVVFYVNDQRHEIHDPDPALLLVDYLRSTEVGLTGTKHSCGQGGCGACTVTLSYFDQARQEVVHVAANSCLRPVCALDGMQVTTIEGLGSVNTQLNPVQYEVGKCNGSQCGYCTPGFVMNMHALQLQNQGKDLSEQTIQDAFDGNICRCTGYRPILFAMKTFAADHDQKEAAVTPECLVDPSMTVRVNPDPVFPFPPALRLPEHPAEFSHGGLRWFRPRDLAQVHSLMREFERHEVKLVVGNTSLGIPDTRPKDPDIFIDISHISSLHRLESTADHLLVGAAVTYAQWIGFLDQQLASATPAVASGLSALRYMAGRTAGTVVRNIASLGGNTMLVARNATEGGTPFPSDLFTVLCALGAWVTVQTDAAGTQHELGMLEFIQRYNSDAAFRRQAILMHYRIPHTRAREWVTPYKVALREVNAHSLVNAALRVRIDDAGRILEASLVYGAIAPVAFHARKTEAALVGHLWNADTYARAAEVLAAEVTAIQAELPAWFLALPYDGITAAYRRSLASSFFYKFYVEVSEQRTPGSIAPRERSAGKPFVRGVSWGSQTYATPDEGASVGQPFIKLGVFEQTTGEAIYTHDIPVPDRGLYGAFVTSTIAKGQFQYAVGEGSQRKTVDKAALLAYLGQRFAGEFVDYITVHDIPPGGMKAVTKPHTPPDPWFCDGSVSCYGQSIGLVVAHSERGANHIAAFVREQCIAFEAAAASDIVLDIDTAVAKAQFFAGYDKQSDDNSSLQTPGYATHNQWVGSSGPTVIDGQTCQVVTGRQYTGLQIHFYMETQSCVAYPGEGRSIVVHSSTQSAASVQGDIQRTLLMTANNVSVNVKRLGGAYGGKTTRSPFVAVPTALAAWKLRRPIRVAMERDVDTAMIGDRHAFRGDYSFAIVSEGDQKGMLLGSSTQFYSNGGNTVDCSFDVMDCAQLGADNAYSVPYFYTIGQICETNIHSNGAMRSYGGIQAMLIQEDGLEAAAHAIGMLPEDVRQMNLYKNGDVTPFGQTLDYCYIREVWARLKSTSNFDARQKAVEAFNAANRWKKRGISMIPLKYGLGYNLGFLMQGGALVNVYNTDGSVLVQVGGVEMGQGILTKVAQIAAKELNVPLTLIQVGATQTNVVPDGISTGATSGTDLWGGAAMQASQQMAKTFQDLCQTLKTQNGEQWCTQQGIDYWNYPNGWNTIVEVNGRKGLMWHNVISQAYQNRVDLSSQALYSTSGLVNSQDQQFYGFTFSAACTEVEIDVLTGETYVLRADICYDMGQSINPAIDIGQIEGAFVMGLGYVLSEEVVFEPDGPAKGSNNTLNTWTYKPPANTSIPIEMHVDLFPRSDAPDVPQNPNLLMSSKGVGEPPLVLSATAYFAVKHAVLAARQDAGIEGWFNLVSPATVQRVRAACVGDAGMG